MLLTALQGLLPVTLTSHPCVSVHHRVLSPYRRPGRRPAFSFPAQIEGWLHTRPPVRSKEKRELSWCSQTPSDGVPIPADGFPQADSGPQDERGPG